MATKPEFKCTIDIRKPETAALIRALLYGAYPGSKEFDDTARTRIEENFPGGVTAASKLDFNIGSERSNIWSSLNNALERINIRGYANSPAPWLSLTPPLKIDGREVTCAKDGAHIDRGFSLVGGCIQRGHDLISLEALELMVKTCRAAAE